MLGRFALSLLLFCRAALLADEAISGLELPVRDPPAYRSPTARFVDHYNYENVLQTLRVHGLSLTHRNFFEHLLPHEELGFFGYHSSTQGFRIFQDIIRMVLEEICDFEIREDFQFLRVPGNHLLNQESAQSFLQRYPHVNNNSPDQQEQLLSMNYALFGNFNNFGSCSVYYFTANRSATSVHFQNKLQTLFEFLGIPTGLIPGLFSIGNELMVAENAILLQFFDFSHHNAFLEPYAFVDRMCYTALPGGVYHPCSQEMSALYLRKAPSPFTPQFRLVINNDATLNPNSPIAIRRYERTDPETVRVYEVNLRRSIKALPFDPEKRDQYRALLETFFGDDDE